MNHTHCSKLVGRKVSTAHLLEGGWLDDVDVVAEDPGSLCDVRQAVNLQVRGEGIWQPHVAGEGAQDQIAHLDAVGGDDITECVVVVTQELGKVM